MLTQYSVSSSGLSILSRLAQNQIMPVIENRTLFIQALHTPRITAILLRHCNLFELTPLLEQANQRSVAVYLNIDHIEGIHPDAAGIRYLASHFSITGIISNNSRSLALGKNLQLETIQRVFAVDSTGLEGALETVDKQTVDLLDISPASVIPYLPLALPLPFIGSGLIHTHRQIQAVLRAGARGIAVTRPDLWQ